jgi:TetR/AcrR family transcriptional regulator, regulator of autoinduction and epiphytic fitness
MASTVKPPGRSRAERALRTRRRVLDCAYARFVEQGYAATTMEQISADAGVAVQTVYYTFRTKGQLLRELVERTAAGEDEPMPVMERPWMAEVLSSSSAEDALALAVEHGTEIYRNVAPLWPAVAAASGVDPEVERYWSGVAAGRRAGQGRLVARLAELGRLRKDRSQQHAADLLFVLMGHDVYRSLVRDAGWSIADYRAWLYVTLVDQLLAPGGGDRG